MPNPPSAHGLSRDATTTDDRGRRPGRPPGGASAHDQTAGETAPGEARAGPAGRAPERPTELSRSSWLAAGKRAVKEFKKDRLQDNAAALTYYGVLSIFPALLVLVSILGLAGTSVSPLVTNLAHAAPGGVRTIFLNAVTHIQRSQGAAGGAAAIGVLAGFWSASGYVSAFMRAANDVYDVPEGRPIWKKLPTRLGVTAALLLLLIASVVIVVVTGGLARHVGQVMGIGSTAVTIWDIAKWPVLLILVSIMFAILYWASPNARRGFRWASPGGLVAVVIWLAASGLFAVYLANFAHYNKVYGSVAGIIVFLIWLWISNVAVLLGAEFDAELERGRAIAGGGVAPGHEPYEELRDEKTLTDREREEARADRKRED